MASSKIRTNAFSLIELLITITLVAIVLVIAMPSWQGMTSKNRTLIYTNNLIMALQFTRATAIKLGEPVRFCGSKSHKRCDGSWQNGAIIVTTKDEVLRILPPIFAGDKLSWNHGNVITFSPEGFSKGLQGSFYYCPKGYSKNALAVILYSTGRVRISSETPDGKEISCNF